MTVVRALLAALAVLALAGACRGSGPRVGFEARTEGVVDVELEGPAAACTAARGTLYTLEDGDREGRIVLGRFSRMAPVPGVPLLALPPDSARRVGENAIWGSVALTSAKAFRMASVDSGTVIFTEVDGGVLRGEFRLFLTYGRMGHDRPGGPTGSISGSFAARDEGSCADNDTLPRA